MRGLVLSEEIERCFRRYTDAETAHACNLEYVSNVISYRDFRRSCGNVFSHGLQRLMTSESVTYHKLYTACFETRELTFKSKFNIYIYIYIYFLYIYLQYIHFVYYYIYNNK